MALNNERLNKQISNVQGAIHSTIGKDESGPKASSQAISCLDLDIDEVNTLFDIISKADDKTFNNVVINNLLVMDANGKHIRCPPQEALLFLKQLERQRQLMGTSPLYYPSIPSNNCVARKVRLVYPMKFRIKIVNKVMEFIDTYSTQMLSNQFDFTDKCIVCMINFQLNDKLRKLKCNHKFHRICVDKWLVKSHVCPLCRTDLTGTGKRHTGLSMLDNNSGCWQA
ncbi:hypothetical protein RN001_015857 [Aquatica leii]|uniref:RING-type domain-containing protein n=1 Tax=Aquatica leii TaxID=1421715 RepID=A0AAN7NZI9_9COLE|nr:hypothetical protein RN001_015857 [Aquatica leii]